MSRFFTFILLTVLCSAACAQQTDRRTRQYLPPTRIVWMQDSSYIRGANNLLIPGNGQADLSNRNMCVMKSTGGSHPAILLDFGRELHGGLRIVTGMPRGQKPVNVRIRFGESVSEAMSNAGENGATNDHAMRDFKMSLPWLGVAETGLSGFRFARIDLLDDDSELQLKEISAVSVMRDIPYLGHFRCSDTLLNKIWDTGAYTVHLNMQNYLWDGIKRDRLVWMGDLHPEVMTVATVFGAQDVVNRSMDLVKQTTPLPGWMNGIGSYSLWWIIIQRDWYLYTGDKEYLAGQREYLEGLLKQVISQTDEKGREKTGGTRFLDWPSSENQAAVDAGLQAMTIMALDAGAQLCSLLGNDSLAKECAQTAVKARKAASVLARSLLKTKSEPYTPGNKQAAALLAMSGVMPAETAAERFISRGGAKGFSTFYGYYMLDALAMAGQFDTAMDIMRTYWGGMLSVGATTFWEDFDIAWLENAARIDSPVLAGKKDIHGDYGAYCYTGFRHSLCHGWASGPTSWLSRWVLGVRPLEAGFAAVEIEPHLGSLQWAEGTFPTPYGVINVRHEKMQDGSVKSDVKAPEGVKVIIKQDASGKKEHRPAAIHGKRI